jgi:hypothetical protein
MDRETLKALAELLDEKLQYVNLQLDEKLQYIKLQLDENTQILKALEHKTDINKAEHDKITYDIGEIKGDIKSIKDDLATVEVVTSKNWNEIAKLKAVK